MLLFIFSRDFAFEGDARWRHGVEAVELLFYVLDDDVVEKAVVGLDEYLVFRARV